MISIVAQLTQELLIVSLSDRLCQTQVSSSSLAGARNIALPKARKDEIVQRKPGLRAQ